MTALLRLAALSVLFGGAFPLFFRVLRLPILILCPNGMKEWRGSAALRFFSDFFSAAFVGLSFCIFLFWQADGIPRLFVFLAAALGAFLVARPLSPLFSAVEGCLVRFVRRLATAVLGPPLRLLFWLFFGVFSVLRKIALGFIKRLKKHYTNLVSVGYRRREPKRPEGQRMQRKIIRILDGREE